MKRFLSFAVVVVMAFSIFSGGSPVLYGEDGESVPAYIIGSESVKAGKTFDLFVSVENNPGVISLRNSVSYDTYALELVSVTDLGLFNGFTSPPKDIKSPYILRWADALALENNPANGAFVKITFHAKETAAPGSYFVSIDHIEARNINGNKIAFLSAETTVTILQAVIGDADGDGEVTDWDAMLFERYLSYWPVEIDLSVLDIDHDDEVTDWDAILLNRYLANWPVELTPKVTPEPTPEPTPEVTEEPTPTPIPDGITDWGADPNKLTYEDTERAAALLASAADLQPAVPNDPLEAEFEDPGLVLWFDHSYYNTPAETVTSNGRNTYQILLAKNEIEGCHMMLAAPVAMEDLTLEISDFTDSLGNVLEKEICYGWYFEDVEGKTVADPIPVLEHEFSLKADMSQMFIIKVKSKANTPSGQYSATVSVKDSDGKEIKKAVVYAYVWDFTLPVASNCKTLTDLNEWAVIVGANRENTTQDGLEDDLYALYYEYLLENRVNCYTLPYAKRGQFWDERVKQYLDDPRMNAYTLCWKIHPEATQNETYLRAYVQAAYNMVSQKQEWLDKAYFYPNEGDEPLSKAVLDKIISYNKIYTDIFGVHKLIIPMHYNTLVNTNADYFKYLENDVNVWCGKTYFFNTLADKAYNSALYTNFYGKNIENKFGTFKSRMAAAKEEGDEVWWYITRFPHNPEITLSISDESIQHRLLFWQQKLYDVDGFLYYMCNEWENAKQWSKKYEHAVSGTVVDTYGNGVLIYPGGALPEYIEKYGSDGYPGPIGSLRLESIRDGVDDYDYFTILDELYGEGTSDLIIKQLTVSLGSYKTDTELFNLLRTAVGNLIAAKQ
ncbi:MAG: DUF4091 domain-containing protein [Clostridia bacterium]|nr:DUF4091 domain-containing protein [Clostridia bacterium]